MDASAMLGMQPVVPVIVIDDPRAAVPLAEALLGAGLATLEITLRTPRALECLTLMAATFPDACIGAGSIRSAAQMEMVKAAGARFAVSPGSSDQLVEAAIRSEMPFVPGAASASEVLRLQEQGYTLMKFFPAELAGGIPMLKALGAPLPEARFFPTGGITAELAPAYLALNNVTCVGGSWIAPDGMIASGDFAGIARRAADAARLTA